MTVCGLRSCFWTLIQRIVIHLLHEHDIISFSRLTVDGCLLRLHWTCIQASVHQNNILTLNWARGVRPCLCNTTPNVTWASSHTSANEVINDKQNCKICSAWKSEQRNLLFVDELLRSCSPPWCCVSNYKVMTKLMLTGAEVKILALTLSVKIKKGNRFYFWK